MPSRPAAVVPSKAPQKQPLSELPVETKTAAPNLPQPSDLSEKSSVTEIPPATPRAGQQEKDTGVPNELELLERARHSDARGDYVDALATIAAHQRLHPTGRLREEREALRLHALIGLGRAAEARQAAQEFIRDFPHSVLLSSLREMLASAL